MILWKVSHAFIILNEILLYVKVPHLVWNVILILQND